MSRLSPAPRNDELWEDLHKWFVNKAKDREADVLFIGGDHIALLEQSQFYREYLAPLHCLCFGSFGDSVENLLWRIENGEAENFTPKAIIVSIGQADFDKTPDQLLQGLVQVSEALRDKQPQAEIFFLQLTPTGRVGSGKRKLQAEVNAKMEERLKGLAGVIEIEPTLTDQNGEIDVNLLFDFFHLSHAGYEKVFEPALVAINGVLNPLDSSTLS